MIEGIPPFKEKAILETDQKINLIYGLNGTGKSTISNLLYDWNKEEDPHSISLEFDNKTDDANSYEINIYNQKFVQDNFYESPEIKGIFSLSKDNAEAQQAIDNAKNDILKLEEVKKSQTEEKQNAEKEIKTAYYNILNTIWEIKTTYSGQGKPFDYCLTGLKGEKTKLYEYLHTIEKPASSPKHSIEELEKEISRLQQDNGQEVSPLPIINFEFEKIETDSILSKVVVGNENSSIAELIKRLGNSDWVRQGTGYLHKEHDGNNQLCPFCQQETISNNFIEELESFFGEVYKKDISTIKALKDRYFAEIQKLIKDESFDILTILQPLKEKYNIAFTKLEHIVRHNNREIEKKLERPSHIADIKSSIDGVKELCSVFEEANIIIKEYNDKIKQKDLVLDNLKTEFWEIMRWQYDTALSVYAKDNNAKQNKIDGFSKKIEEIERQIKIQEQVISENQGKTINIDDAIKNINDALIDMGIVDFKIKKHSDSLYELSREGQDGNVFRSLSEGEKMIISLLYFIEQCKGKRNKEDTEKKKIIVIDDPISSLSHIYVYNVGRLLINEFTDANPQNKNVQKYEQVFILTHSLYFFYEMAIIKRKDKEDDYNQKLFRIQKSQQGSHIYEMNYLEIQNDYHAYWMIVKDSNAHPALIANCMRNIIEYFFSFVEKKELNNVFNEKQLQSPRFRAFNRYINRESHSIGQNIFDIKEFNYDDFKEAFGLVFKLTGYEDHYKRMIR